MDVRTLFSEQKQLVAAIIAGLFAIVAAYIRRDKRPERTGAKKPILSLLLLPLGYLIVGTGLLAAEFFSLKIDPERDLSLDNPGAILCLAGCVLVVAGVVWLPINFIRLLTWPKPKELPGSSPAARPPDAVALPLPPTSSWKPASTPPRRSSDLDR